MSANDALKLMRTKLSRSSERRLCISHEIGMQAATAAQNAVTVLTEQRVCAINE